MADQRQQPQQSTNQGNGDLRQTPLDGPAPQHYPDQEDVDIDLAHEVRPDEREDRFYRSLLDRLQESWQLTLLVVVLIVLVLVLVAMYINPLVGFLTSPLFFVPATGVTILAAVFMAGFRYRGTQTTQYNWLVVRLPQETLVWLGTYTPALNREGSQGTFDLLAGFKYAGLRSSTLSRADLLEYTDTTFADLEATGEDEQARIRLNATARASRRTETVGLVISCAGEKIEFDEDAGEFRITYPDTVDQSSYDTLRQSHQALLQAVSDLSDQLMTEKQQKLDAEERARTAEEEAIDRFIRRHKRVAEAHDGRTTTTAENGSRDHGNLWDRLDFDKLES